MTAHESTLRERLDNATERLRRQGRFARAWLVADRWTDWQSRRQWERERAELAAWERREEEQEFRDALQACRDRY